MTTRLLSDVLQEGATALLDYAGPETPLDLMKLVDVLEHAAAIAAEHEYSAAHGTVRSDFHQDGATVYPPLVRLLAEATILDEPIVVPQLEPDFQDKPWLAPDVTSVATCGCGFRAWLTAVATGEDRQRFDEDCAAHGETCTLAEVTA
ncbi:MAG: hypothetical protein NVV66_18165 [Cellulomonas sp.]|uniref:hypothetical protein n=1 Tax=Cellulomonas sp. TaxID=40001 RepID=UPI0025845B6A|nr:hypothetical protein [Cellulomonas sp.]MCR6706522.1 hypothetical protein [Cellulomonas sp.]